MFMLNELLYKELSNHVDTNTSDIQRIKDAEVYSTSEVKTNKKWIDGKPIYRKIITYTNTTTGAHDITTFITNYDYIRITNWDYHTGNFTMGTFGSTQSGDLINVWLNRSAIHFECSSGSFKDGILYVEIEYTKTTN